MNKILCVSIIALIIVNCVACNKSYGTVNYTYDTAIISTGDYYKEVKIKEWSDWDTDCYCLTLVDESMVVVSRENCLLVKSNGYKNSVLFEEMTEVEKI